jgi:hypothetical protein
MVREVTRNLRHVVLHIPNPGAYWATNHGSIIQLHKDGRVIASITYLRRAFLTRYIIYALVGDSTDFALVVVHYILYIEKDDAFYKKAISKEHVDPSANVIVHIP